MDLIFAYLAGLLTLINPCVLPILPTVLASALQQGRLGPVYLSIGMSLSFVTLGLIVTVFGYTIGLSEKMIATFGAAFMIIFGVILIIPGLSETFSTVTSALSSRADTALGRFSGTGAIGQIIGGISLGAVWSPCIGPTLGGAISLASQGKNIFSAGFIMMMFSLGVSTVIISLAYFATNILRNNKKLFSAMAKYSKLVMGLSFVFVGVVIITGANKFVEAWLIDQLPTWFVDLSVIF